MFNKIKIVKFFGVSILLSSLVCITLPFLTSCSTVAPAFTVTNATKDWVEDSTVDVAAMWKGYYFDDVNNPADNENIQINMHGHEDDIEVVKDSRFTHKWKDGTRKIQSCNIRFKIKTDKDDTQLDAKPFKIDILWTIKHSSFEKISTITIKPYKDSIIHIKQEFTYTFQPDISSDLKNTDDLKDNSLQVVDSVYNREKNPKLDSPTRQQMETHLTNDLIWYQYLIYNSLAYVWIDDTAYLLPQWVELNYETWKFDIDLEYNYTTQIFDYIQLHCKAGGNIYTTWPVAGKHLLGTGDLALNYTWGNKSNLNKNIDALPGPKLMGAYTVGENGSPHFPQSFSGTNPKPLDWKPYTQNFLSLVPSTEKSYQEYDLTIKPNMSGYSTWDIGQHVYFLPQARLLGLEYRSGQNHIQFRTSSTGSDSFGNWQFAMPSYTLSGMSYDFDKGQFTKSYKQKEIKQCYVDINDEPQQSFSNWLYPGSKPDWAGTFMNGTDININNQDPDFIQHCWEAFIAQDQCIDPIYDRPSWRNITIYDPDTEEQIMTVVPYYQVIQELSRKIKNSTTYGQAPYSLAIDNDSNMWTYNDGGSFFFGEFSMGLNYLFKANQMIDGADNVFTYTRESLAKLNNDLFNNNPDPDIGWAKSWFIP